jgi:hypothetical protein
MYATLITEQIEGLDFQTVAALSETMTPGAVL